MSAIVRDKHPWVSKVHVVAVKAQRPLKAGRRLGRREDQLMSARSLSEESD